MNRRALHAAVMGACALAVLAVSAPVVQAQTIARAVLREMDLRRSSSASLYDAIAELRPEWLLLGADLTNVPAAERVVLFLNGEHVGYLNAVRVIETAQVLRVRLRGPQFVRRTMLRFPRQEFAAALFVTTRAAPPAREPGRITLSLETGLGLRSLPHLARVALHEQGYIRDYGMGPDGLKADGEDGTIYPPSLGGTAHYRFRGGWGAAVAIHHAFEGQAAGLDPTRSTAAVSAVLTSTEAALLVTREGSVLRAGVGPAVRRVNWTWTDGFCRCDTSEKDSGFAMGVAADMVAAVPIYSRRVFPEFKVLARYYPSQHAEYSELQQPLQVGGLVLTVGVGIATRF